MTRQSQFYIYKRTAVLLIVAGALPLLLVWFSQRVLHMAPCGLCLLERWPYRILIFIGVVALFITSSRLFSWILGFVLMVMLVSMGISLLHIGVEQGWWKSPLPECNSIASHQGSMADRFESLPDHPSKPCDLPSYIIYWLPISLTMFNGMYAFGLFYIIGWKFFLGTCGRRIYF